MTVAGSYTKVYISSSRLLVKMAKSVREPAVLLNPSATVEPVGALVIDSNT